MFNGIEELQDPPTTTPRVASADWFELLSFPSSSQPSLLVGSPKLNGRDENANRLSGRGFAIGRGVQVSVAFGGFLWLFQLQLFQLRHRGRCCVLSMTGLVPPFTLGN
jgi:hypothetical protein